MIKLWAHECTRVFQDRLVNDVDREKFDDMLKVIMKEKFKREWDTLVKVQPLLFASFVPLCYPGGDTTKKPFNDIYCELSDREKTKTIANEALIEFNQMYPSKKMDLVLFTAAIEHVVKIHRIITTEFGHSLLIGVGGSGRKSCTELATHIATYDTFKIEITKSYNFEAWREDMRDKLYLDCGTSDKSFIFLLNDTQIVMESFLEDINNILNNGEIPNLFSTAEEKGGVVEAMRELNKATPGYKQLSDPEIFNDFIGKCKQKVHCVLAMSPIGEDFKRRLRMFPALVNCCAIDYFLAWPEEALKSVAEHFIKDVEDLPEKEGIVKICVDMQLRVTALSDKYFLASKQRYYVTPTSYLVLIRRFKDLLGKKRDQIDDIINKYDRGIKELALAKTKVNELQNELTELMPKLVEAKKENDIIKQKVEAKKIDVAAETKVVEKEAADANETKSAADAIQYDCEYELSNVMPIFAKAQRAVN
jgi:dynein heavy chain